VVVGRLLEPLLRAESDVGEAFCERASSSAARFSSATAPSAERRSKRRCASAWAIAAPCASIWRPMRAIVASWVAILALAASTASGSRVVDARQQSRRRALF